MGKNVNLSAPWEIFYSEMEQLFGMDPEIDVSVDREAKQVKLLVDSSVKADALAKLLPAEKAFGETVVKISVVPANEEDSLISLYERAFFGNPAFAYTLSEEDDSLFDAAYVVFEKEVVQFYCDNLADCYRNRSTLYQEIAKDVFGENPGVFFCTDTGGWDDDEELPFSDK